MSLTIGFSDPGKISIGGKSIETINALKKADEEAAAKALDEDKGETNQVRTSAVSADTKAQAGGEDAASTQSLVVKMLLKRMQELQKQLQEQQELLAATQARSYPTEEAKTTAVMAIQGQISATSGAIATVAAALVKELSKDAGSGNVVNTTA